AENRSRPLRGTALAPGESHPVPHSWWRRADVLVAASLLIISSLLLLPLLVKANRAAKQIQCQDNLRGMFAALMRYGDAHNGELPKVEENAPRNFAGMFVPVLYQDGLLNGVN